MLPKSIRYKRGEDEEEELDSSKHKKDEEEEKADKNHGKDEEEEAAEEEEEDSEDSEEEEVLPDITVVKYLLHGSEKKLTMWGNEFLKHAGHRSGIAFNYLSSKDVQEVNSTIKFLTESGDISPSPALFDSETVDQLRHKVNSIVREAIEAHFKNQAEADALDLIILTKNYSLIQKYVDIDKENGNIDRIMAYLTQFGHYGTSAVSRRIISSIHGILRTPMPVDTIVLLMSHLFRLPTLYLPIFKHAEKLGQPGVLKQIAWTLARYCRFNRSLNNVIPSTYMKKYPDLFPIMENRRRSELFHYCCKELDLLAPKSVSSVYRYDLVEYEDPKPDALLDIADVYVNAFVNCGYCTDSLMCASEKRKEGEHLKKIGAWMKDGKKLRPLVATTASLGLIYLWNPDVGMNKLAPYLLYSGDDSLDIITGALLAAGVMNANVATPNNQQNITEPLLSLLIPEFRGNKKTHRVYCGLLSVGIGFVGTENSRAVRIAMKLVRKRIGKHIVADESLDDDGRLIGAEEEKEEKKEEDKKEEEGKKEEEDKKEEKEEKGEKVGEKVGAIEE
eukprot:gnl/Carplike_NY0171/2450_a3294_503.p1 GENE.gnl/Carplike_NY0171/2450_a3294_503~~gnl/Carplike_NY0171/2450_a3294_503.p1  ORF type:complete len:605 (-),score=238.72 gnl/Carplike_NY0171/2450_a3294_503:54-1733(-)